MFTELWRIKDEPSKNFNKGIENKIKYQIEVTELKNTITELKNTLKGLTKLKDVKCDIKNKEPWGMD